MLALNLMADRTRLAEIAVTFESETRIKPVTKVSWLSLPLLSNADILFAQFEDAGLHPVMLKNIELCGYKVPTPIQAYCLPSVLKGIDIIGIAQTGMYPLLFGV